MWRGLRLALAFGQPALLLLADHLIGEEKGQRVWAAQWLQSPWATDVSSVSWLVQIGIKRHGQSNGSEALGQPGPPVLLHSWHFSKQNCRMGSSSPQPAWSPKPLCGLYWIMLPVIICTTPHLTLLIFSKRPAELEASSKSYTLFYFDWTLPLPPLRLLNVH